MSGAATAGLVAVGAAVVGAVAASLRLALHDVTRAQAEQALRPDDEARLHRVHTIFDDLLAHSRAVAMVRALADMVLLVSVTACVALLRGHRASVGTQATPGSADPAIGGAGAQGGMGSGLVAPDFSDAAIAIGLCAVVMWVLGVSVPMSVAAHAGARVIVSCSALVRAAFWLTRPFAPAAAVCDELVRRLTGAKKLDQAEQLEAEIISVIDEGQREGALDEEERDMIEAAVRLRDKTVAQLMTPRTDVEAMPLTSELGKILTHIKTINHSRIPVYEGSLDQVVGVFYVRDLMRWLAADGSRGSGKPFDLRTILRPALFVPETKTARELLNELLARNVHLALVADEYGGTSGLVTIEDIVEEVFGEIRDEYEPAAQLAPDVVLSSSAPSAELDARARIEDVNEVLRELKVQLPEGDEYDTVGGYVMTIMGRIPAQGESFREGRMEFTVLEALPTRVLRVRLDVRADEDQDGGGEAGDPEPTTRAAGGTGGVGGVGGVGGLGGREG